jgi:beta-phosphoglucomutase-like phosphatase (HAD superfamily)
VTRPIELVIFDCDGVLVDSERLAVRIDVRVLAALGWPLSEREVVFADTRDLPSLLTRDPRP